MTEEAIKIVGSFEIAKLRLQAEDVLVIRTDRPTGLETADRIRKHLGPLLPAGVKVMIINPDIELSVLTKSEFEARIS